MQATLSGISRLTSRLLSSMLVSVNQLAVADPTTDLPTFVASPASGGVKAQVNVASTHFYPTCNQAVTPRLVGSEHQAGSLESFLDYG